VTLRLAGKVNVEIAGGNVSADVVEQVIQTIRISVNKNVYICVNNFVYANR